MKYILILTLILAGCGPRLKLSSPLMVREACSNPDEVICSDNPRAQEAIRGVNTALRSSEFKEILLRLLPKQAKDIQRRIDTSSYRADIQYVCMDNPRQLALGTVNGSSIIMNECALSYYLEYPLQVSILGHEIMHNIGYTHPDNQKEDNDIPYLIQSIIRELKF